MKTPPTDSNGQTNGGGVVEREIDDEAPADDSADGNDVDDPDDPECN